MLLLYTVHCVADQTEQQAPSVRIGMCRFTRVEIAVLGFSVAHGMRISLILDLCLVHRRAILHFQVQNVKNEILSSPKYLSYILKRYCGLNHNMYVVVMASVYTKNQTFSRTIRTMPQDIYPQSSSRVRCERYLSYYL